MPRPPDAARDAPNFAPDASSRGLSLLLAPRRAAQDDAARAPLAKRLAAAMAETLAQRFGLRAGFAPDAAPAPDEPGPGLAASMRAPDGAASLEIGQSALYDLTDALFGGDGSAQPYRDARRPSEFERAICDGLAPAFAQALGAALERDDIVAERVVVAQERARGQAAIGLKMRLIGRESRLTFALPPHWLGAAAVEPARAPSLDALDLDLAVSLRDAPRPLADVFDLAVGDVLALSIGADAPARVTAQGVELFEARIGQSAGRYTIRLERRLDGAAPFFEEHGP